MKLKSKRSVAFQGEHGAYSEMAVFSLFAKSTKSGPSQSFKDVFDKVKSGKSEYGVVPVENTLGGIVYQVWDLLNEYGLEIFAETKIQIIHCLIGGPSAKIKDIDKIYAHYQAALQCESFLKSHKNWLVENAYDTAGSVKIIKELPMSEKEFAAAIASERAAQIYKMKILQKNIQDSKENYTRFLVLRRRPRKDVERYFMDKGNKFTCALSIKHEPGSLLRLLQVVDKFNINLTSIHSRPNKARLFEYNFFLEGIFKNPSTSPIFFSQLKKQCQTFKLLGVYNSNL